MHELSIAESVVQAVRARTGDEPVAVVRLRVGRLAGVVPDALRFCFDLAVAGTPLEGSELVIDEPQGAARCRTCEEHFALEEDLILLCPCGSADVQVMAGSELDVVSVDMR
ncbi:MAG: hydrogenase maturation nickel metallochaperone HypA [Nocardioidaceae bacterium]